MAFAIKYFAYEGDEVGPVLAAIEEIPARFRAAILSDIERVAEYGFKAPVSVRSIKGHSPMVEIRTGGYRTFFVVDRREMWILACCKKQDQRRTIDVAHDRMKLVLER